MFIEPVGRKNPIELADEVLFGGAVDPRLEVAEEEKVLVVSASKSKWEEGAASKIEFVFFHFCLFVCLFVCLLIFSLLLPPFLPLSFPLSLLPPPPPQSFLCLDSWRR